jgi:hypothetical protein
VTDISPPNSPAPAHPEQAESSIEVEEEVVPAPKPPFKEVRCKYRKRRTSPSTPRSRRPSLVPAGSIHQRRHPRRSNATIPGPSSSATRVCARQTSGAAETPGGKQNSAHRHSRRVKVAFTKAKPCVDGIRVNPGTSDDLRALSLLLEERKVSFHSSALSEAKTLRAVLRTVPVEIGLEDVQSDLVDQGLEPIKVSRMIFTRT